MSMVRGARGWNFTKKKSTNEYSNNHPQQTVTLEWQRGQSVR